MNATVADSNIISCCVKCLKFDCGCSNFKDFVNVIKEEQQNRNMILTCESTVCDVSTSSFKAVDEVDVVSKSIKDGIVSLPSSFLSSSNDNFDGIIIPALPGCSTPSFDNFGLTICDGLGVKDQKLHEFELSLSASSSVLNEIKASQRRRVFSSPTVTLCPDSFVLSGNKTCQVICGIIPQSEVNDDNESVVGGITSISYDGHKLVQCVNDLATCNTPVCSTSLDNEIRNSDIVPICNISPNNQSNNFDILPVCNLSLDDGAKNVEKTLPVMQLPNFFNGAGQFVQKSNDINHDFNDTTTQTDCDISNVSTTADSIGLPIKQPSSILLDDIQEINDELININLANIITSSSCNGNLQNSFLSDINALDKMLDNIMMNDVATLLDCDKAVFIKDCDSNLVNEQDQSEQQFGHASVKMVGDELDIVSCVLNDILVADLSTSESFIQSKVAKGNEPLVTETMIKDDDGVSSYAQELKLKCAAMSSPVTREASVNSIIDNTIDDMLKQSNNMNLSFDIDSIPSPEITPVKCSRAKPRMDSNKTEPVKLRTSLRRISLKSKFGEEETTSNRRHKMDYSSYKHMSRSNNCKSLFLGDTVVNGKVERRNRKVPIKMNYSKKKTLMLLTSFAAQLEEELAILLQTKGSIKKNSSRKQCDLVMVTDDMVMAESVIKSSRRRQPARRSTNLTISQVKSDIKCLQSKLMSIKQRDNWFHVVDKKLKDLTKVEEPPSAVPEIDIMGKRSRNNRRKQIHVTINDGEINAHTKRFKTTKKISIPKNRGHYKHSYLPATKQLICLNVTTTDKLNEPLHAVKDDNYINQSIDVVKKVDCNYSDDKIEDFEMPSFQLHTVKNNRIQTSDGFISDQKLSDAWLSVDNEYISPHEINRITASKLSSKLVTYSDNLLGGTKSQIVWSNLAGSSDDSCDYNVDNNYSEKDYKQKRCTVMRRISMESSDDEDGVCIVGHTQIDAKINNYHRDLTSKKQHGNFKHWKSLNETEVTGCYGDNNIGNINNSNLLDSVSLVTRKTVAGFCMDGDSMKNNHTDLNSRNQPCNEAHVVSTNRYKFTNYGDKNTIKNNCKDLNVIDQNSNMSHVTNMNSAHINDCQQNDVMKNYYRNTNSKKYRSKSVHITEYRKDEENCIIQDDNDAIIMNTLQKHLNDCNMLWLSQADRKHVIGECNEICSCESHNKVDFRKKLMDFEKIVNQIAPPNFYHMYSNLGMYYVSCLGILPGLLPSYNFQEEHNYCKT